MEENKKKREGTCETLLLMFGLLLPVERVESPRWTVGEQRWEFLGLKLLLDAVELTAAGRHCREDFFFKVQIP